MECTHIVGHYRYREMPKSVLIAERKENLDSLPATMYACMVWLKARNKREAMRDFRESFPKCSHQ